ncbi:MAG: hypothetical protein OEZ10_06690 [Gammaproteobacteria bacterium]|nr:hypothetical protein [Gammaproteobacteria bacterium]
MSKEDETDNYRFTIELSKSDVYILLFLVAMVAGWTFGSAIWLS